MSFMTPYRARKVLGIDQTATKDEIRRARKRLVRSAHPDAGGSTAQFNMIQDAFDVLMNQPAPEPSKPAAQPKPGAEKANRPFWARGSWRPDAPGATQPRKKPAAKTGNAAPRSAQEPPKPEPRGDMRGTGHADGRPARRERRVNPAARYKCAALLRRSAKSRAQTAVMQETGGIYGDPKKLKAMPGARHLSDSIRVEGRRVSITVREPMNAGQTEVAVLSGTRDGDDPRILRFSAPKDGFGRVRLPEALRETVFPWAEHVEIDFRTAS